MYKLTDLAFEAAIASHENEMDTLSERKTGALEGIREAFALKEELGAEPALMLYVNAMARVRQVEAAQTEDELIAVLGEMYWNGERFGDTNTPFPCKQPNHPQSIFQCAISSTIPKEMAEVRYG